MNDAFNAAELQEELDMADQRDSQLFQQQMEEMTREDLRAQDFWKLEAEIKRMIREYGREAVCDRAVEVIDSVYNLKTAF